MKTGAYILLFAFGVFILSCSKNEKSAVDTDDTYFGIDFQPESYNWDTIKGIYVGDFNGSDIRLTIGYSSPENIVGYSSFKGQTRNLSGKVKYTRDSVLFTLGEPGDLSSDGEFRIAYNPITFDLEGTWTSYSNPKLVRRFIMNKALTGVFEWGDPIDKWNLSNYLNTMSDSLGEIYFSSDGVATCEYYPVVDENGDSTAQMIRFYGGWTFQKGKLFVDWEANSLFSSKRTPITIFRSEDVDGYYNIRIEDRILYPQMY